MTLKKVYIYLSIFISVAIFSIYQTGKVSSQQNIPIPVKIKDAFILKSDVGSGNIVVDLGDNTITTDETVTLNITPKTIFVSGKNKKKQVDPNLLRPGVFLEIDGEKLGTNVTANIVTVLTNLEEWKVDLEGYFEKIDKDTAQIDGQRIKLENNGKIKGASEWKSNSFKSLGEMMLGAEVKVKGIRKSDGIVYATEIMTEPNDFSKSEKELRLKLSQNLGLTGIEVDSGLVKSLFNGTAVIGGNKFKLVEDLDVQTYVNKIGFKLVPRYIKDLDRNDPSKISFRFYVVDDNSPNAFAFADGSVFVHTGLLRLLKNEAQLAGVIGHEMAHATHEHTRRTLDSIFIKTIDFGTKTGLISDSDLITFGLGIFANKFSRDMENQADRVGLRYMYDAGYDPRESPKVWREMKRLLKNAASENPATNASATNFSIIDLLPKGSKAKVDNFLYSSHPEATVRLKNLNREIAYNYYETDFSQSKVRADEYKEALGYYFGWIKKPVRPQPTSTPTKTVPKTPKPKKRPPVFSASTNFSQFKTQNSPQKIALVIGNSNYTNVDAVSTATADAALISESLRQLGFKVTVKKDITKSEAEQSIAELSQKTSQTSVVFFYYAGHSLQINEKNYLVPVDFTSDKKDSGLVELNSVFSQIFKKENTNIAALDSFYELPDTFLNELNAKKGFSAIKNIPTNSFIGLSNSPGVISPEAGDSNSTYSSYLSKNMLMKPSRLEDVFVRTRLQIINFTERSQIPWEISSIKAPFYFTTDEQDVRTSSIRNSSNRTSSKSVPSLPFGVYSLLDYKFSSPVIGETGKITSIQSNSVSYFVENIENSSIQLIEVRGSQFQMGAAVKEAEAALKDADRYDDGLTKENVTAEMPQHLVNVPGFFMSKNEITQAQWQAVMGSLPKIEPELRGANLPVVNVSWEEAQDFCEKLSWLTQKVYRLPTEAEWEYAARAGTTTPFSFGETLNSKVAVYNWATPFENAFREERRNSPSQVGSLDSTNRFGLQDMHGNVWEWTQDVWHPDYDDAPDDGSAWEKTDIEDDEHYRVIRGGSWDSTANNCRSAFRAKQPAVRSYKSNKIGFRVVSSSANKDTQTNQNSTLLSWTAVFNRKTTEISAKEKAIEDEYRNIADSLISENRLYEAQIVLEILKEKEYEKIKPTRRSENADTTPYSKTETEVMVRVEKLALLTNEKAEIQKNERDQKQLTADQKQRLLQIQSEIEVANKAFRLALNALLEILDGNKNDLGKRITEIDNEHNLQRTLSALNSKFNTGAVAIYTVIGADSNNGIEKISGDKTRSKFGWIILVTPDGRKAYPIDANDLESTVFQFRAALSDDKYDPKPLAMKLYRDLFRQTSVRQKTTLETDLTRLLGRYKDKMIMWSLDGVLRYIPTAALHDGNNYLIEKYRNITFTSQSLAYFNDEDTGKWQALGLGVSEKRDGFSALPGVEKELNDIVRIEPGDEGIFDGRILLNNNFRKDETIFLWMQGSFPVIHIASHFGFNPININESFLLIGDGKLTFDEIRDKGNLFGTVDLLTLSACDTAMSGSGKESEGFAYLAQRLGAKTVIASLWKISDEGTPELMIRFYKIRAENSQISKGEAFRKAQLEMLGASSAFTTNSNPARSEIIDHSERTPGLPLFKKDENQPFAHPHYWSSFVLIGNWR